MRGTTLETAENLVGYYYDYIEVEKVNGKSKYAVDTLPQRFNFVESSTSAATIFQSTKGLEQTRATFGDVYQTKSFKWKIQTSNTNIDFKENGKVKVFINGVPTTFTIRRITYLTSYNKGLSMTRIGQDNMSTREVPKLLDLE